jgi:hypothetical protein
MTPSASLGTCATLEAARSSLAADVSPTSPGTVTGRVSPAVTAIAVVHDGQEGRRPLASHFGAWVVCLEQWSPY